MWARRTERDTDSHSASGVRDAGSRFASGGGGGDCRRGLQAGIAGSSMAFDRARGQGSSRRARSKDKCGFLKFLIW